MSWLAKNWKKIATAIVTVGSLYAELQYGVPSSVTKGVTCAVAGVACPVGNASVVTTPQ